jgi:hypothetical protein
MRFLRLLLALPIVAAAGSAGATPVTHTVNASLSNVSATVSGTLGIVVHTNLGDVNGSASASGPLASGTESGTVNLDWGNPVWSSSLAIAAGGATINTGPSGSANGNATLDLFGFIPVNFTLTVAVDNISLGVASNYGPIPTAPLDPGTPGAGPWTTIGMSDLSVGGQIDFSAVGPFGINVGASNIAIGPSVVSGIPLPLTLSREGGNPGTGSRVTLTIPSGLALSLPAQPTSNIATPGCEFGQTSFGCTLDVTSVDVTLTSLTFTNISGTIAALSNTVIVPEPAAALLLGAGLAGLAGLARRRRAGRSSRQR